MTHTLQPYVGQTQRGLLADGVVVPLLAGDFFSPPQEQLDWGLRETRARLEWADQAIATVRSRAWRDAPA